MMSLKFNVLLLTFLLIASQAFAQVIVSVDMKQTGPTAAGAVLLRVGKNTDATYRAKASYNGQPTLHAEEKVIEEKWTSAVTIGPGATGNSTEETIAGDSVVISAKSADPGTYSVSIKFTITFTIESPNTKREDPYSGVGLATLNVKNGRFEVKIKPADLIPQYTGDTNGYRNKLGIGEIITICVFPEGGSNDTVVFDHVMFNGIRLPQTVNVGEFPRTIDFDVFAMVNGTLEGPESIGVTVIEPTGAGLVKKIGSGVFHEKNTASVGFHGICFLTPDDVSFSAVEVHEGTCPAITTGYFSGYFIPPDFPHPVGTPAKCNHNVNPNAGKRNTFGDYDKISSGVHTGTRFSDGTFIWNIPWEFKCGTHTKQIAIMTQHMTIDTSGNMTISKGSVTVSAKVSDPTSPF